MSTTLSNEKRIINMKQKEIEGSVKQKEHKHNVDAQIYIDAPYQNVYRVRSLYEQVYGFRRTD
jgi:hypothetical protein